MQKRWCYLLILTVFLASCAPLETPSASPEQTATPALPSTQPTLEPTEPPPTLPAPTAETPPPDNWAAASPAIQAAKEYLAGRLRLATDDIQVLQVTALDWSNACLGIYSAGMLCAEVITPGYIVDLEVVEEGRVKVFVFHTDASGAQLSLLPEAVFPARQALLQQTGLLLEEIDWVSLEAVEWRNSCLGVTTPGVNCLDVIVPGYRIVFQVGGERYEYHTNQDGSRVVLATLTESSSSGALLTWSSVIEPCTTVEIDQQEVRSAPCGIELVRTGDLPASRAAELEYFSTLYARQASETTAGIVTFRGSGRVVVTPAETRMLAEWARLVYDEAASGRNGAAWSLAFSWHREGGIAGFCDDLGVYLTGEAVVTACKSGEQPALGRLRLDSQQLADLYAGVDSLAPFEIEQADPATADAMTIHFVFNGQGAAEASAHDQSGLIQLASELVLQGQTPPDPAAQALAEQALIGYLAALTSADYAGAAALYGGSYGLLIDNNPSLDPDDHAALFRHACTITGHICDLSIRNVVSVAGLGVGRYRFMVELENPHGVLFELGQCCTDASDGTPPHTQFAYQVELVDGSYRVMTLPPYGG